MPHDDVRHPQLPCPGEAPIQLIDEQGRTAPEDRASGFALPDAARLVELYRKMVVARRFDVQVTALTRQGRLATYPSAQGQEASEIASVVALEAEDWLFPTYRDTIALLTRGVQPHELLTFFRGEWHMGFDPYRYRISPQSTPLATQTLHAAGLATAVKLKKDPVVALTLLGDGATSEGDTHEACNFAAVWHAPCVFVIQNNGYAISVPADKQFKARSLADRAIGYGMPGYWVDGNDAAAMFAVVSAAVERARTGGGPSLIEAVTYRTEAHTNSDDPTRYRERDEEESWRHRDPIERLGAYLRATGDLGPDLEAEITAEAEALAAVTRDAMNAEPALEPLELFDHVYVSERPVLREQRAALAAELAVESASASASAEEAHA